MTNPASKITSSITFTARGQKVYTGMVALSTTTLWGQARRVTVALRVDGREGSYRVDLNPAPAYGTPWEAIDGGTGFRTLSAAKAFGRAWVKASKTQNTTSPAHVPRPAEKAPRVTRAMVLASQLA